MADMSTLVSDQRRVSSALNSILVPSKLYISQLDSVQRASENAFNAPKISILKEEWTSAAAALTNYQGNLERVQNPSPQVEPPSEPVWNSSQNQQLHTPMDSAGQDIQDNLSAQEQLNQSIEKGASSAGKLGEKIGKFASSLLSVKNVGNVLSLADEATQMNARLSAMNDGLQSTQELQQMIFQSAQRSRTAYQDTVNTVAQLEQNAVGAFSSNAETIAFAENLNKQFAIAGMSQQDIAAASSRLTQALGAGALSGQELNSIFGAAPGMIQTIADYMGVPVEEIRNLADEGAVTSDVVKNAMLSATEQINSQFGGMPMTFSQIMSGFQDQALMAFQPVLESLTQLANTPEFQAAIEFISSGLQTLASVALSVFDVILQGVAWIGENWSWLEPIVWGIVGAVAAWQLAQMLLNTTLLANPLTWVLIAIIAVIAAVAGWIQSVGGLRIAWLTVVNAVLTAGDNLRLGLAGVWLKVQSGIDNAQCGIAAFKVGVQNLLGSLKVKGLMILQEFINGAIDRINDLINLVNSLGFVSIETISHVEFGTNAAIEEEEARQRRMDELSQYKDQLSADQAAREQNHVRDQLAAKQREDDRNAEIKRLKEEQAAAAQNSAQNYSYDYIPNSAQSNVEDYNGLAGETAVNTGNTAANTAAMANSMDAMDEELKYMRDAAEQDIINRFTLAELKIDMTNNNTVRTETDFSRMAGMLEAATSQILAAAAEGGHL